MTNELVMINWPDHRYDVGRVVQRWTDDDGHHLSVEVGGRKLLFWGLPAEAAMFDRGGSGKSTWWRWIDDPSKPRYQTEAVEIVRLSPDQDAELELFVSELLQKLPDKTRVTLPWGGRMRERHGVVAHDWPLKEWAIETSHECWQAAFRTPRGRIQRFPNKTAFLDALIALAEAHCRDLQHWLSILVRNSGNAHSETVSYFFSDDLDAPAYIAEEYDLDTVTQGDVEQARLDFYRFTQDHLKDKPETLTVWRCGTESIEGDVTSVTLDRKVAERGCEKGYYGGTGAKVRTYQVKRKDVLLDVAALWPYGFQEAELLVHPEALTPLETSLKNRLLR